MGTYNPKLPTKHTGTDKYITFFVSRNRTPTGADYRQPETGTLYSIGTVWQVSKNPTSGSEGDLWMLSKIVANIGYWVQITSGVIPSGAILTLSDTAGTLVYPTDAGNIQLYGTAGQINVVSDPVDNRIVFSLAGGSGAVDSFAVPLGSSPVLPDGTGLVTITTGSGVLVTGGVNTYSIALDGSIVGQTITANSSDALHPTSGNWNIFGASTAAGTSPVSTAGSVSTLTVNVQKSQAIASTDATKVGLSNFNSGQFTVDANGFVSLIGGAPYISLSPYIVGTDIHSGYSTIALGIAAAIAGGATDSTPQNVYIKPKQDGIPYTEDLTLPAGVNLIGYGNNPTIIGKITMTTAGNSIIQGLTLQTNSDFFVVVSGSSASNLTLESCFLSCTNHTGISFTSSSSSSIIRLNLCRGDITTTGISLFSSSSTGTLAIRYSNLRNTGASVTSSTISSGNLSYSFCGIFFPVTTSGTSSIGTISDTDFNLGPINTIALTVGGSGVNTVSKSSFNTGSASCISISSVLNLLNSTLLSNTANVITGTGTLNKALLSFSGSGSSLAGTLTITTFPTA